MDTLRLWINRLLGRETVVEAELLGVPLRLAVQARRELRRIHSISEETPFVRRMFEFLANGDVVFDVGANIGLIGLLLARHSPEALRIHCFEPEPQNFEALRRNISKNRLSERVFAHRLALTDESGEAVLFVRGGPGEGRHSMVAAKGSTASIRIPTLTASDFIASQGDAPDLVKIDVEGAEGRVLAGMEPIFQQRRPREVFMELHLKGDGETMPGGAPILEWMAQQGYELVWELGRGRSRHVHFR
jgi:FkbM family methyltransferase